MIDSQHSSEAVWRLLQITRQSWLQPPARPEAALAASPRPISSHRLARQQSADNVHSQRMRWGLQPTSSQTSAQRF